VRSDNTLSDWHHLNRTPVCVLFFSDKVMQKLPEVEAAKALMIEAVSWSVMKWLREKKRVRKAADQANAALDALNRRIKDRWPENVRVAYASVLSGHSKDAIIPGKLLAPVADAQLNLSAKRIKEADDAAYRARMDAEATFDEAEKQLSTRLAREGCRKAIQSWELHEKAIQRAEALASWRPT
jgi:hypothetical protein